MRLIYWGLGVLAVLIMFVTFGLLKPAGFFKQIVPHFEGDMIHVYNQAYGTEDLDIDYRSGTLYVSADHRRSSDAEELEQNGIYSLDLNNPQGQLNKMLSDYNLEFHPHGISIFSEDSMTYCYVINHLGDRDLIELFQINGDTLVHDETFEHELMVSPNDIVGVSTSEFYITNDHSSDMPSQDLKEDYLRLSNRNIIHYRNGTYKEAANSLAMPNGINVSDGLTRLYTATTLSQELVTYDRDLSSGELSEVARQSLDSGLDNIDIDQEGNLWIGSHPKLLDFISHASDEKKLSPSQILKLTPTPNSYDMIVDEVFLSDGADISGSSVGVYYKGDLLIGAVFENKVWRGRME